MGLGGGWIVLGAWRRGMNKTFETGMLMSGLVLYLFHPALSFAVFYSTLYVFGFRVFLKGVIIQGFIVMVAEPHLLFYGGEYSSSYYVGVLLGFMVFILFGVAALNLAGLGKRIKKLWFRVFC